MYTLVGSRISRFQKNKFFTYIIQGGKMFKASSKVARVWSKNKNYVTSIVMLHRILEVINKDHRKNTGSISRN